MVRPPHCVLYEARRFIKNEPSIFFCCRSLKQLVGCNLQQGVYKKGSFVSAFRAFNR